MPWWIRHLWHNQVLCRLRLHDWQADPDVGSTCRWCGADGYYSKRR